MGGLLELGSDRLAGDPLTGRQAQGLAYARSRSRISAESANTDMRDVGGDTGCFASCAQQVRRILTSARSRP